MEDKKDIADETELAIVRKPERKELLAHLNTFRNRLPVGFKFDRDEMNARYTASV